MSAGAEADIRDVIVHRPGSHYRGMNEKGLLQMGGPYLTPDSGGKMIPMAGISEEEIRRIAKSDPAVKAGLPEVEVRPWSVAMKLP
jgi:uncharacterized protein YciI